MGHLSTNLYIPPFSGIRLYECRDHITLVPVPSFREFFAYGKIKANEAVIELEDGTTELFWDNCSADEEVWAVVQWIRYEDGHEEKGTASYLRTPATEEDARKKMRGLENFYRMSKQELLALSECFKATEDDYAYIESRYPNYQSLPSDPKAVDEYDVYQARLKVLAGLQPRTVELIKLADETKDPQKRQKIEREAVQAYFAELAHFWSKEAILAWQRTNPVGTEWICEFASVLQRPQADIDPLNQELALNWLRQKYNLMTAEELASEILKKTGQRLMPGTIKKRRERLGLTTKRHPGPSGNHGQ